MNPNDTVRIKLTKTGKKLIVDYIDKHNDSCRKRGLILRLSVPSWDGDNWIKGQFWCLMEYFDGYWSKSSGGELPFTEMQLEDKQ